MASAHRARGILKIDRNKTVTVTGRATAMCDGVDDNSTVFPSPSVPTATVRGQVAVVNKAESVAKTRAIGAATARTVQRTILVGMLETDLTYIQGCADKAGTHDQAVNVLQAGGVVVAGVGQKQKGGDRDQAGLQARQRGARRQRRDAHRRSQGEVLVQLAVDARWEELHHPPLDAQPPDQRSGTLQPP